MKKTKTLVLISFILAFFQGCAVRRTTEGERVITITPTPSKVDTLRPQAVDTTVRISSPTAIPQKPTKKGYGYRVQIFAFSERSRAELAYQDAKLRLSVPVYLVEEQGADNTPYKVRVGNFLTREEAEKYRDFLRQNGYPDAFIVPSEIELP